MLTDKMKQINWLRAQAAYLLKQAKAGKNASLYAELFADQLPPYLPAEEVAKRLADEGAVEQLALLMPEIAQHAEWFEQFRVEVLKFLGDDGDEGTVIEGEPEVGGGDGGGEGFQ